MRTGTWWVGLFWTSVLVVACSSTPETTPPPDTDAAPPDAGSTPDAGAGSDAGGGGDAVRFPGESWDTAPPEDHGLSTEALAEAAEAIGAIGSRQCLVVVRDGFVVHESYFRGDAETRNAAWSVTKSLGSALFGVAVGDGLLGVDDPVGRWVGDPPGSMDDEAQLRHVLGQVSESDPAGTGFSYDSGAVINTLPNAIASAAGMGSGQYARMALLEPTGMDRGVGWDGGNVRFGEGAMATCRGLARLGWLMVNEGRWDGEQLVPAEYVREATRPSFPDVNMGYGYLWWLNGPGAWERPLGMTGSGSIIPEAPPSMFFATGLFSQFIFVLPESDTVVVTMGMALLSESIDNARRMWRALAPAVP